MLGEKIINVFRKEKPKEATQEKAKAAEDFKEMEGIYGGGSVETSDGAKKEQEVQEVVGVPSAKEREAYAETINESLQQIKEDLIWVLNLKGEYKKDGDLVMQKARIEALKEQFEGLNLEERLSSFDYESEKEAAVLYGEMLEVKNFIKDEKAELEKEAA